MVSQMRGAVQKLSESAAPEEETLRFRTGPRTVLAGMVGMIAWTTFAVGHAEIAATPGGRVLLAAPILFILLRILPH